MASALPYHLCRQSRAGLVLLSSECSPLFRAAVETASKHAPLPTEESPGDGLDQDLQAPAVVSFKQCRNHHDGDHHGRACPYDGVRGQKDTQPRILSTQERNSRVGPGSDCLSFTRCLSRLRSTGHCMSGFSPVHCFPLTQQSRERSLHTSTAISGSTAHQSPTIPTPPPSNGLSQQQHTRTGAAGTNTVAIPFAFITPQPTVLTSNATAAHEMLIKFGHAAFRGIQLPAIMAILKGGDALALMTTGGGKSLIYQVSSQLCHSQRSMH